jgi:hypothetical protein
MLAHKAVKTSYYWPFMNEDFSRIVQNYDKCQRIVNIMKNPPEQLSSISALSISTQWAEMEALVTITTRNVKNFLWKSIVCRYGIPHAFVTNNSTQFNC